MLETLIKPFLLSFLFELSAAIAGLFYLKKLKNPGLDIKVIIYYLWFVLVIEVLGLYTIIGYFSDYKIFSFIKDTVFEQNYWLFNIYNIIKFSMLIYYFILQLEQQKTQKVFKYILIFFIIVSTLELFISNDFFINFLPFSHISGTIFLMLVIFAYYYELLMSDSLLYIYKNISFYISVSFLVWHLVVTPLFIYSTYITTQNVEFLDFYFFVIQLANVFLYGLLFIGFITCRKYVKKRDMEMAST